MAGHIISGVLVGFMVYMSSPGSSLFSYHPALMSVAFLFLLPQAVLVFHPRSSWFLRSTHQTKVTAHLTLQLSALLVAAVGATCVYAHKNANARPHYTSWHSWVGIAAMLYLTGQCVHGAVLKNASHWAWVGRLVRRADLKLYHATSGALVHALVSAAVVLGMCSDWYWGLVVGSLGGVAWWVSAASVGLLLMVTLQQITGKYQVSATLATRTNPTTPAAATTSKSKRTT